MSFDTVQFYNNAIAIVAGCGFAALSFRLLPPPSPEFRSQRLLQLALRNLRHLAATDTQRLDKWETRMYGHLAALPEQAEPLQRAQLITALSVGIEIIQLRRAAFTLGKECELKPALQAFAQGNTAAAVNQLARIDDQLARLAEDDRLAFDATRARGYILAISDAVAQHREYLYSGVYA